MYLIGHLYFSLENECHFFLRVLPHNQLLTRLNLQCNLNRPDKKRATLMTQNSSFKLNITNQLVVYYTLVISFGVRSKALWCVCQHLILYAGKKKNKLCTVQRQYPRNHLPWPVIITQQQQKNHSERQH